MRSSKAELRKRLSEVLALRLQGGELHDLVQYSSEQGWKVGVRMLQKYIAQTDKMIEQSLEKDRGKLLNRHILQRQALFAKAVAVNDYATAKGILKDLAELQGLYPAKRTELTGKDGQPLQLETKVLTDEERRATVLAILAEESPGPSLAGQNVSGGIGTMATPGTALHESGDATGSMANEPTLLDM
jgi:hypothetical protein